MKVFLQKMLLSGQIYFEIYPNRNIHGKIDNFFIDFLCYIVYDILANYGIAISIKRYRLNPKQYYERGYISWQILI